MRKPEIGKVTPMVIERPVRSNPMDTDTKLDSTEEG